MKPLSNQKPVLREEALYGLAGEIVKAIDPYTEADPVAILTNLLVGFGNIIDRGPYFRVEETKHFTNLFAVYVGATSKGRKGQSWSTPRRVLEAVDPQWARKKVTSGLSSGEGLIAEVSDDRDDDTTDKRLLLIEEEFAQVLKQMKREGNVLSPIIRDAWDGKDLHPLTKNNPIRATEPHISVIGHITRDELLRHLSETEMGNGFANRFLWFMVARSKVIANPMGVPHEMLESLADRLASAIECARTMGEMKRDGTANAYWASIYEGLSDGKPGLVGAVTSRAEAQVLRLSMIYALLDLSQVIRFEHLDAALALWEYSEASVKLIFGDSLGDPVADKILTSLKQRGSMSETEIRDLFGRNRSHAEIYRALEPLRQNGLAAPETFRTNGRPVTIWRATT